MAELENINFSFAKGHEIDHVDEIDLAQIKRDCEKFHAKYSTFLKENSMNVYIKKHKEKSRKTSLYFIRMKIASSHGTISSHAEGYGLILAVHNALDKIKIQIKKKKEKPRGKK